MICDKVHQAEAVEDCVINAEKDGRKNTHAAAKAAFWGTFPDDSLAVEISGLSQEEREKQAIEEIAHIKLEQRVMDLKAKRDRLVSARRRARASDSRDHLRHQDGQDNHEQSCDGHMTMALVLYQLNRSERPSTPHMAHHILAITPEAADRCGLLHDHRAGAAAANVGEVSGRLRSLL